MPRPDRPRPRPRPVRRSYDRDDADHGANTNRSTVAGVAAGELFENVIRDVLRAGTTTNFKGAVDVELNLHNTKVDDHGFLVAIFAGNDPQTSSVSVKLATRVYLGDLPNDNGTDG
jgi:hypothetical protein